MQINGRMWEIQRYLAFLLNCSIRNTMLYIRYTYIFVLLTYSINQVADTGKRPEAFVAEYLQTFALVTTVLNTATTKAQVFLNFI